MFWFDDTKKSKEMMMNDIVLLILCLLVCWIQSDAWHVVRHGRVSCMERGRGLHSSTDSSAIPTNNIDTTVNKPLKHPLSLSFPELTEVLGGSGKARTFWQRLRQGRDPLEVSDSLEEGGLSNKVKEKINTMLLSHTKSNLLSVEISEETLSPCGTRKLLVQLPDKLQIESVLIPAHKYDRTTLCISTQVGCDRGCLFCLTGTMGIVRNLTSDEIISQVLRGLEVSLREGMPAMTNIVFMGMGDAGRNIIEVNEAVQCLTDRDRLSFAQSKVTISTVGPSPEVFFELAKMPATLAWSLHSPDDIIRRKLVPSTRHSTIALRDGLLQALQTRPSMRTRTIMIALTLIDGINDSEEDARKLADFVLPMLSIAPKIALDLIPYNDNDLHGFKRPSNDSIHAFQEVLRKRGLFCTVRITRGDEESSACGMLATKRPSKANQASVIARALSL